MNEGHDGVGTDSAIGAGEREALRKLGFFELAVHWRDSVERPAPSIDWRREVEEYLKQGAQLVKEAAGSECVFEERGGGATVAAKRVPALDIQQVSGVSLKIGPVPMEGVNDFLARANYMQFFSFNALAMLSPPPGSPTYSAAAALANAVHPVDGGVWVAKPITSAGQIEEYRNAKHVKSLRFAGIVRVPTLFYSEASSLGRAMSNISAIVGADVSVKLELRVKNASRNREATRRLRQAVEPEQMEGASRLGVETADGIIGGALELLAHNLSAFVTLTIVDGHLDQDDLVAQIRNVSALMEDRIEKLVQLAKG